MDNVENEIYLMLNRLRGRPGAWLGTPSISKLKTFIAGYQSALYDLGVYKTKGQTTLFPLDFKFMSEFVKMKTNNESSEAGWANLLLEECKGDEENALEQFFKCYDEFCSLKAVSIKKAILSKENILANDNMLYAYKLGKVDQQDQQVPCVGKKTPVYDRAQSMYIIKLSEENGYLCAIETAEDIQLCGFIFHENQILGDKYCSHSPKRVFGAITSFEEIPCEDNFDFHKLVHLKYI